jgi:single-stranded-DNA-specific exonuclease
MLESSAKIRALKIEASQWQVQPLTQLPEWFVPLIKPYLPESSGAYAAQLLWQRSICQPEQVLGFIDPNQYQPTSPFAFGHEMERAVARLQQAIQQNQKIAIWGDFDADGVTATAVLWEGLQQFLPFEQLTYWIPNRLTESHGLSTSGIAALAAQGYRLIVTCDTGSTNLAEIDFAHRLGIDLIITDHHLLLAERPPVTAILNPRTLAADHPFAHLSGVAVAYKLIEALYETLPEQPQKLLSHLLDLVAIGLIADLVELTADGRYLAQLGITQLQRNQDPIDPPRPGVAKLLELCRRSGDRPTDISFGLGPRINAISRIQGDARFCVELLTSRDRERCQQLALETELANARRKALQRDVGQQVKAKIAELDLSTTQAIVLADPQWPVGILGLVAGQIAQDYGRPTFLLSLDISSDDSSSSKLSSEKSQIIPNPENSLPLARGSAQSVNQIDLYALLQQHSHLLHRFGGHPFAVGLSLPVENISLFSQAINQQLRLLQGEVIEPAVQADLVVTVAELGKALFQELKLLEPYGMGNPVPKLLIQNCWFTQVWHKKIQDLQRRKLEYIKTEFELCDDSGASFPGVWWGHYKDELPLGRCDALVELDFNSYEDAKRQKRYEVRLIAVKPHDQGSLSTATRPDLILDWRNSPSEPQESESVMLLTKSPISWSELRSWVQQAEQSGRKLALAYGIPAEATPQIVWQQLIDIAESLSQSGEKLTGSQIQEKLHIGDCALQIGLQALRLTGYEITSTKAGISIQQIAQSGSELEVATEIDQFLQAVQEEQFMRQYFYAAPLATIQATLEQLSSPEPISLL